MRRVLVLETNEALRRELLLGLRRHDIDAEVVDGVAEARATLVAGQVDAVVLGPRVGSVRDLLGVISESGSPAEVVALVGDEGDAGPEWNSATGSGVGTGPGAGTGARSVSGTSAELGAGLAALREGAADFVPLGAGPAGLALALLKLEARRVFAKKGEAAGARAARGGPGLAGDHGPDRDQHAANGGLLASTPSAATPPAMVGENPKIAAVLSMVRRLAGVRAGVLVGGESGTGKELVARALHDQSPWRDGPFVAVNCAAIPPGLVESELFGHARGAFTDAVRDKRGLFEAADRGTLFLDEIADLPLGLQVKLLRVLQDGVIRRVGDVDDLHVEVRVVAATARDLLAEVKAGRFREDLYYRLAGLTIQIPPLRERRDDIPLLARHFLVRASRRLRVPVMDIQTDALQALCAHAWPGNVRELENTIERAAVMCTDGSIDLLSLPDRLLADRAALVPAPFPAAEPEDPSDLSIKRASRRAEEGLIRRALEETGGNRTKAAELLEISHRALLYKIKEYGIVVPRY